MISQSSFHRWCDAQRLVDSAKVVVHEIQRNHVPVVLQLLAESVCEPGESAHPHPHRKVAALYE